MFRIFIWRWFLIQVESLAFPRPGSNPLSFQASDPKGHRFENASDPKGHRFENIRKQRYLEDIIATAFLATGAFIVFPVDNKREDLTWFDTEKISKSKTR